MQTDSFMGSMAGDVQVPDVFSEDLNVVLASLDFARVWAGHRNRQMTAQELRAAAVAARQLADEADEWADSFSEVAA